MVKLVDTPDLGSGAVRCVGSSPILGISSEIFSEMKMFPVFLLTSLARKSKIPEIIFLKTLEVPQVAQLVKECNLLS